MIAVLCFHKNVRGIAEPRFSLMHPQWLQCGFYVFKLTRSSAAPLSPHVTALNSHLLLTFVMLVRNGNQWKADCHQLTCSLHVGQPLTSGWTLFRPLRLRSLRHGERERQRERGREKKMWWWATWLTSSLQAALAGRAVRLRAAGSFPIWARLYSFLFLWTATQSRTTKRKRKKMKTVQSVRTICDSGSSNHRARVVVLQRTVCLHAAQMWLKVSLNKHTFSVKCSQILYSLCAKWNIPGRLLLQFWWLSTCSMRTVRHRRSLLKSLKAVLKNIKQQAQQEKVQKQQRRPQTLNDCKEQLKKFWEHHTSRLRLASQHQEQQRTVVFRKLQPHHSQHHQS